MLVCLEFSFKNINLLVVSVKSLTSFCDCVMCVPRTGAELKIIFNEIQTIYFCPCAHLHACLKSVRKNFMICEIGLN